MSIQSELGSSQHKDENGLPLKVPDEVPSCFELRSLLVEKRNNIGAASIKEAMMHGIEEILAISFELGSGVGNTGLKNAVFSLLEMT